MKFFQFENPNRKKLPIKTKLIIAAIVIGISIVASLIAVKTNYRGLGGEQKTVTIEVIKQDGTSKEFKYRTAKTYIGEVLSGSGLVEIGEQAGYQVPITVDGITADETKGEKWVVTKGGEKIKSVAVDEFKNGDKYIVMFTVE